MAAVLIEIADAVVTMLNAGSFSQSFTAVRSYADWDATLEELDTLRVDVTPATSGNDADVTSRLALSYVCSIDIGIRKRFDTDDQDSDTGRVDLTAIDDLLLLTEELYEYFFNERLTGYDEAVWESSAKPVEYSRAMLRDYRQFTSVIRHAFRLPKAIP